MGSNPIGRAKQLGYRVGKDRGGHIWSLGVYALGLPTRKLLYRALATIIKQTPLFHRRGYLKKFLREILQIYIHSSMVRATAS